MKRNFISYILVLCLVITLFPASSYAVENETDSIYMYDNFEYSIASNWTPLGTIGNGGSGWASRWAGDKLDFTSSCPGSPRVTLTPEVISERVQIKNSAAIYRKFGTELSALGDREYLVDTDVFAGFQGTNTVMLWSMGIGDNISIGFEDKGEGDGILPYIKTGSTVIYGEDTLTAGATYKLTIRISVNSEGNDTVYLRITESGSEEKASWDMSATLDIASNMTYISYEVPNSTSYLYVLDVAVTEYDVAAIRAYDDLLEKADNGMVGESDLVSAMSAVSALADSSLRQLYISDISSMAQEIGITDIMENKISSSIPGDTEHIYAEDIENITLTYRYALSSDTPVATISDGENEIEAGTSVSGGNLTITPASPIEYNKSYTVTVQGLTDFKGDSVSDNTISFTTSIVPAIDIADGGEYGEGKRINWLIYDGITTTAKITIDGSEPVDFANGSRLSVRGEYTLTLYSEETEGEQKTEERSYSFTVLPAYEPSASNLRVDGIMATGNTLTAVYDFEDRNTEPEGDSVFQWYRSDSFDGAFTPIVNATERTYTLTEADEDIYILFEVTPVAVSDANSQGETVRSEPVAAAFRPTASDIKITGDITLGEELKASFVYGDINGNENEGTHDYIWYNVDYSGEHQIGTGDTYTIADTDFEKQIFVRIVPKSTQRPYDGKPTDSDMIIAPAMPVAKNVRIEGVAEVGNTLSGYYTYYDINGDEQANTSSQWINSDTGAVLGNSNFLKLTSDMAGMSIAYVVTPMSINEPKTGAGTTSPEVTVSKNSSGSGGEGFSYSGSTSGSTGGGSSVKVPSQPTVKPSVPVTPAKPEGFGDMSGHWAESYVADLKKAGLINGISATEFAPSQSISRAEFVVMMVRLGNFASTEYQGGFNDVSLGDWFSASLQIALNEGIISHDTAFRPTAEITRMEAAKIASVIMTKLGYKGQQNEAISFADDAQIPEWAKEYIAYTAQAGIMLGDDLGNFRADAHMNRAEAATIMWRLYQGGISK